MCFLSIFFNYGPFFVFVCPMAKTHKPEEDVVSIYERACRMAGITSSSRIARELVNNKVFLDYAGLNTQDIKAVCVALLVRIFIIYDYFSLLIKRKCIIGYNKKSRVLRLFLFLSMPRSLFFFV